MADNRTAAQRSYNMSQIRSFNTTPELVVRKYLFRNGFRFRLHAKMLAGRPDIILPKYNSVVFVHGCFWHGHRKCKNAKMPISNHIFWENKIRRNSERDIKNSNLLKKGGWNVYTIWECQLSKKKSDATLKRLVNKILIKY